MSGLIHILLTCSMVLSGCLCPAAHALQWHEAHAPAADQESGAEAHSPCHGHEDAEPPCAADSCHPDGDACACEHPEVARFLAPAASVLPGVELRAWTAVWAEELEDIRSYGLHLFPLPEPPWLRQSLLPVQKRFCCYRL